MKRYKYSAFYLNHEFFAWENELQWLSQQITDMSSDYLLEAIIAAIPGTIQGNTSLPLGREILKIWHKWEKRDGHDALIIRVRLGGTDESVDQGHAIRTKKG